MPTDTELLDILELASTPGLRWIARPSTTGRGFRLHQSTTSEAAAFGVRGHDSVRGALLDLFERSTREGEVMDAKSEFYTIPPLPPPIPEVRVKLALDMSVREARILRALFGGAVFDDFDTAIGRSLDHGVNYTHREHSRICFVFNDALAAAKGRNS